MTRLTCRLLAAGMLCWLAGPSQATEVRVWVVDPLTKVLTDAQPQDVDPAVRISAARGESEAGQVAFRSDAPVKALGISVTPLVSEKGAGKLEAVESVFLNYHLLEQATQPVIEGELCAKPPVMLPDAFCLRNPIALPAHTTRSAWITVWVPEDAPPGTYRSTVTLDADGAKAAVPIEVRVYEAVVPRKRSLKVFNWLFYDAGTDWGQLHHRLGGEPWDDRDWETLKAIARNMVAHRQNLFTVPVLHNVLTGSEVFSVKVLKDGESYRFDFSLFDRCVETFLKEDPDGTIVGGYLALFGASGRTLDAQGNLALRSPAIQLWDARGREKAGRLESMDVDDPIHRRDRHAVRLNVQMRAPMTSPHIP
ncbi:MAG: hypothetical protein NTW87_02465 [Planctomycetota bacterium]|nr:hypothetical protein [Planctomycetota bacterium]